MFDGGQPPFEGGDPVLCLLVGPFRKWSPRSFGLIGAINRSGELLLKRIDLLAEFVERALSFLLDDRQARVQALNADDPGVHIPRQRAFLRLDTLRPRATTRCHQ